MLYFKLPFNEKLYSTDENSHESFVSFYSFDGSAQIDFNGKIIEINPEKFDKAIILSDCLQKNNSHFIPETKEEYLENLEKVIGIIKENQLPKLVYSRRKIFTDFHQIDLKESFKNLCKSYPNAFRYIFIDNKTKTSWMGAFSEVLGKFNKTTHEFETMSLAGTLPITEGWTQKEIEEQKPVSTYIQGILNNYSENISVSRTYDHISGNIKHLRTDFKAGINPENLDKLIRELHPTPAVCGIPKKFCKEKIEETEKYPRELYAGYIKIETEEAVQYFVNLRCAKLYQDTVHLFVGGGITAQSSPAKEWNETELKSEAVLKNLVILA